MSRHYPILNATVLMSDGDSSHDSSDNDAEGSEDFTGTRDGDAIFGAPTGGQRLQNLSVRQVMDAGQDNAPPVYEMPREFHTISGLIHFCQNINSLSIPMGTPLYRVMHCLVWYLFKDCTIPHIIYGSLAKQFQMAPGEIFASLMSNPTIGDIDIRTAYPNELVSQILAVLKGFSVRNPDAILYGDVVKAIHITTVRIRIFNQTLMDLTYVKLACFTQMLQQSTHVPGSLNTYLGSSTLMIQDLFRHLTKPYTPVLSMPLLRQCMTHKWQVSANFINAIIANHCAPNLQILPALSPATHDLRALKNCIITGLASAALLEWVLERNNHGTASQWFGAIIELDGALHWRPPQTSINYLSYFTNETKCALQTVFNLWLNNFYHLPRARKMIYNYRPQTSFEQAHIKWGDATYIVMLPKFVIVELGTWQLGGYGTTEHVDCSTMVLIKLDATLGELLSNKNTAPDLPELKVMDAIPGPEESLMIRIQSKLIVTTPGAKEFLTTEYGREVQQSCSVLDTPNYFVYTDDMDKCFYTILAADNQVADE